MKRLLLVCSVVGISFAFGGAAVISLIASRTQVPHHYPPALADFAVPVAPLLNDTVPPPQLFQTPPRSAPTLEDEHLNGQTETALAVLDADTVSPFGQTSASPFPDGQISPVDHLFVAETPDMPEPSFHDSVPVSIDEPRPRFLPAAPAMELPPANGFERGAMDAIDLTEGMLFLVQIHRRPEHENRSTVNTVRVFDGKQVSLTEFAPQSQVAEMRIYAQAVAVDQDANSWQLSCDGTVVVLANQSMLRGKNLIYADGMFSMESTEILTADAKIESGQATFAFPLGTLTIESIVGQENAAAASKPVEPETADLPPAL